MQWELEPATCLCVNVCLFVVMFYTQWWFGQDGFYIIVLDACIDVAMFEKESAEKACGKVNYQFLASMEIISGNFNWKKIKKWNCGTHA